MLAIVLLAVLRSAVATRLDSFTIDENYHITAGVSYIRTGDYRINPEHPPLVKLWVGAFMTKGIFTLPPVQIFNDKNGERIYCAETVFFKNDPDRIQRRSRLAMYCFNGLLLFIFGLVARNIFGDVISLSALAFLAIDPTIAAHMPVVMTDLPITLTGAIALLLASVAFTYWKPRYVLGAAVALGLTLATKHSGIIMAEVVTVFGLFMALRTVPLGSGSPFSSPTRPRRLLALSTVLLGALVVLWGTYRFRYTESSTTQETFNRPLADKIADLESPRHRFIVSTIAKLHLFPRAYIWGFADIIRAGVEGRGFPMYFMDHIYTAHKPHYYFPVQILVKVPLGLLVIAIAGLELFLARRLNSELRSPYWLIFSYSALFLLTLAVSNSFYAGVRHAMPIYPVLALFAGAAVFFAWKNNLLIWRLLLSVAALWALVSAIPILRPWEYYNALAGGTSHAYLHFSDEGLDLSIRTKELAKFYHERLEPNGELPVVVAYLHSDEEWKARGIHTVNDKWESGELSDDSSMITGTLIVEAITLNPLDFNGLGTLQDIQPTERFGNLLIFRGTFSLPLMRASRLFFRGIATLYAPTGGPDKALPLFQKSASLNPTFYPVWIELGNYYAQRGEWDNSISAFLNAQSYSPEIPALRQTIADQIQLVRSHPIPSAIHQLRNPFME